MRISRVTFFACLLSFGIHLASADVSVTVEHVPNDRATAAFAFKNMPARSPQNLATHAIFTLVDGERDLNGAGLSALHDGKLAGKSDDPAAAFFFADGTVGGRIKIDLGQAADVGQINTYSWHTDTRAPQVYRVYVADGSDDDFQPNPRLYVDPAQAGWTLLASVDTRAHTDPGGQYGVSIGDIDSGSLGKFRYVLFDISRTESDDPLGNTFFDEVEIVAKDKVQLLQPATHAPTTAPFNGHYAIIDTTGLSAEMKVWSRDTLQPVCDAWYPKLIAMLPSDGFTAPKTFTINFRDKPNGVPAFTLGNRITCNLSWVIKNRDGQAIGAVIHEMVHVVQHYHFGRKSVPFWLQEGIPDYIRWYIYEPQTHGARITHPDKVNYDDAYRASANFLNWATQTYDRDLVKKVNASLRQGKYADAIWKDLTGRTLDQLNAEWKQSMGVKPTTTQTR